MTAMTFPNKKQSQAIGIFDSGVGGLSIAKRIHEHLPNEQLIYVADSAYAPYGDISVAKIEARVNSIATWLVKQNVKAIVIACNTATVNAIDQLRQKLSIPIIGVEPAIKPAAKLSNKGKVALLVTHATANNKRFLALVEQHKQTSEVFIQPCPGLVELVEAGEMHTFACQQLLESYITPLITRGVDTLVLGCTHYPFLREKINTITNQSIAIMETAQPVTEQLKRRLAQHQLLATIQSAPHQYFTTKSCPNQQQIFSHLWGEQITLNILAGI